MEVKLESLIAKIKKDGVEEAKKAADKIIQDACCEAVSIIDEAKRKAEEQLEGSRKSLEKLKNNTENSLRQAARDLVLVLKQEITTLFDNILKRKVADELDVEFVKELIVRIIDNWAQKKDVALEALVNKVDKKKLEDLLLSQFKSQVKDIVEIKIAKSIDRGFRIGIKGEDVYYDFTDESILESLKEFLNPQIVKILDKNNG
ncbi:MAG TPA: hypothetical protein ENH41_04225 [Candidatus Omnitrophica bacterium]|nr:hypothetical protein [Candidatus Omnitrophota bacterium]